MYSTHRRITKGYGAAVLFHLLLNGPTLALADVPTFTAQDSGTDALPTVEGNDVIFVENDAFSVTFGSEWSTRIRDAVNANCASGPSTQCQDGVKQALGLGATEGGLHARVIPILLLAGAAAAGIIASIIMISHEDVKELDPIHIQIPKDQNEELSEWDMSAGKINVQPVNADAFELDMNSNPSRKPSPDQIPTATLEANGDLVITVGDLAPIIEEQMGRALCHRSLGRRALEKRVTVACFANQVRAIMRLIEEGGRLQAFQYVEPMSFPDPQNDLLQSAYEQTESTEERLHMHPNTPDDVRTTVQGYTNWIAFAESVGSFSFVDGKMTIKGSFVTDQQGKEGEDQESADCPTDPMMCKTCGGNSVKVANEFAGTRLPAKCIGTPQSDGKSKYAGCGCIDPKVYTDDPNVAARTAAAKFLQRFTDGDLQTPFEPREPTEEDPEEEEPTKELNKSVKIILENTDRNTENYRWVFYETDQGQNGGCLSESPIAFKGPEFQGRQDVSGGDYNMTLWGRECQWRGNGQNLGELFCDNTRYGCEAVDTGSIAPCPDARGQYPDVVFCGFDSDGPATTPEWQVGTCSFRMWQEFYYPKYDGGPVPMHFEGVKDANGKDLGGAWGNRDSGDTVENDQVIVIDSQLPADIQITVTPFDGQPRPIENWKNSKHFTFLYGVTQEWPEFQEVAAEDGLKQSCETVYQSVFDRAPVGYHNTYIACSNARIE